MSFLVVWTFLNWAFTAVNTVLYVQNGEGFALAGAIFCGLMGVVSTALLVKEWGT